MLAHFNDVYKFYYKTLFIKSQPSFRAVLSVSEDCLEIYLF